MGIPNFPQHKVHSGRHNSWREWVGHGYLDWNLGTGTQKCGTYQHGLVGCRGLDHSNGNGHDCGISHEKFHDSARFFLVLRKKFDDVSFFHMYYRVLNMRLVFTTKGLGFRFSRDKDLILLNLLYFLDFRLQQVGQCGFSGSPGYQVPKLG